MAKELGRASTIAFIDFIPFTNWAGDAGNKECKEAKNELHSNMKSYWSDKHLASKTPRKVS
eukprot:1099193-Amphidinium_carterae.1